MGGFAISPKGMIAVTCYNAFIRDQIDAIENPTARDVHKDNVTKYRPKVFPGRNIEWAVHVFDQHGKRVYEDAIPGSVQLAGLGIDSNDDLYVQMLGPRAYDGKPYPNDISCTVFKAHPKVTRVLSTAKVPVPMEGKSRPKRPPDVIGGPCGQGWIENAEWIAGGVGAASKFLGREGGGCWCDQTQMTTDYFGRSFVPEPDTYTIPVFDPAGNVILRIGRYGNIDDGVPLVKSPAAADQRPLGGDDTGANTDRPALQRLLADIQAGKVDVVICYKLDRLSRSLVDFVRLMTLFEKHETALVSTTQRFDTSTSMGRLMLNVLMSFAEFERQVIGERIRDKLAAAKRKGKYTGGRPPLGYDVDRQAMRLAVNPEEAKIVRFIFERFLKLLSGMRVAQELNAKGLRTKAWTTRKGQPHGGALWNKVYVYLILNNRRYLGDVVHQGQAYRGEHEAIIDRATWEKVQAILSSSKARRGAQTRRKTVAMLKGLVKCGHCGKAMGDRPSP